MGERAAGSRRLQCEPDSTWGFALRCLAVCFALLWASFATAAAAEKRVALVIGNSAYQHTAALPNPRNDAEDMAAALRRVGFEVIEGLDLDKAGMDMHLAQFARMAEDADAAVVFYAGHGMQYQGQNYLVPVDAKLEDEIGIQFETTRLEHLMSAFVRVRGVRILLLDACRNNPLAGRLAQNDPSLGRGFARISSPRGMLVASATQANEVAYDGGGRNSFFTGAMVKELEVPGLEVHELFRRVAETVSEETGGKQLPETSSSLDGAFYFNRGETAEEAWARLRDSSDPEELGKFIEQFPDSYLVDAAKARLDLMQREKREAELEKQLRALKEQQRLAEEAARKAKEERLAADLAAEQALAERQAAEEAARKRAEEERLALAEAERRKAEEDKAAADEAARKAQAERQAAEAEAARKAEEARVATETAARQKAEAERVAAEDAARRALQEKLAAEKAAREKAEEERVAAEEAARKAEEERLAAEKLAKEQAEQAKLAAEELAKREAEAARLAAEEAERQAEAERLAEEAERQKAVQEEMRLAALPPSDVVAEGAPRAAPAGPDATPDDLVRAAQGELMRIGCYAGPADGILDRLTRDALANYAEQFDVAAVDGVTDAILEQLKVSEGRLCAPTAPPSAAPAVAATGASSGAERCSEILERAQLGEVTDEDKAILQNACR
jgi:uncharacterized caspase-like protein